MNMKTIIVILFALVTSFSAKGEKLPGKRMIKADEDSLAILIFKGDSCCLSLCQPCHCDKDE